MRNFHFKLMSEDRTDGDAKLWEKLLGKQLHVKPHIFHQVERILETYISPYLNEECLLVSSTL